MSDRTKRMTTMPNNATPKKAYKAGFAPEEMFALVALAVVGGLVASGFVAAWLMGATAKLSLNGIKSGVLHQNVAAIWGVTPNPGLRYVIVLPLS